MKVAVLFFGSFRKFHNFKFLISRLGFRNWSKSSSRVFSKEKELFNLARMFKQITLTNMHHFQWFFRWTCWNYSSSFLIYIRSFWSTSNSLSTNLSRSSKTIFKLFIFINVQYLNIHWRNCSKWNTTRLNYEIFSFTNHILMKNIYPE